MPTKVKAVHVAFNRDPNRPGASHIAIVDTKKRLWERFSDMPHGEWSEVPLPDEPAKPRPRVVQHRRVSKPAR